MIQVKIHWVVKIFMILLNKSSVIYHNALLRGELQCNIVNKVKNQITKYDGYFVALSVKIPQLLCGTIRRHLSICSICVEFNQHVLLSPFNLLINFEIKYGLNEYHQHNYEFHFKIYKNF